MAYGIIANSFGGLNWTPCESSLIGAFTGWGFLFAMNLIYKKIKGVNGIGMGDAKLLGALGALFGWQLLPYIILIASLSGLLGGYFLLKIQNKDFKHVIPFGPFISLGGIITLLWMI